MPDGELYRDGELAVTATAIEAGGRSWAVANVARAYVGRSATGCTGIGVALGGLLIVAILVASGGENLVCYSVGALSALIGIVLAVAGWDDYDVMLEMVGGKRKRAWSGPKARAEAFAQAVNAAKTGK